MNDRIAAHDALAFLIDYPVDGFREQVESCKAAVAAALPAAGADVAPFAEWVAGESPEDLEEHYTRTFDNSTTRALEVGWHVFGETYDRGAFLVRMRELIARCGLAENGELPDHLGNVLSVLARLPREEAAELGARATLAISKIAAALAEEKNPWVGVLDAAWKLVGEYADSVIQIGGVETPRSGDR